MKKLIFALFACIVLAGCNKENDSLKEIELTGGTQISQEVYADETSKTNVIKFKTIAPWTASVTEVSTRAGGSDVEWLQLNTYEGKVGEQTLTLILKVNTTGEERKAEIKIVSGGTMIAIVVLQKATKEDGTTPKPEKTKPSGSGELSNVTAGKSVKLVKVAHSIIGANRVSITFIEEPVGYTSVVTFTNPFQNGKLKSGTYTISHYSSEHNTCEWLKPSSVFFTPEEGTVKVERDGDVYTFTIDMKADKGKIIKGSFTGVPQFEGEEVKVTSISLNETGKTLDFGGSFTLNATILPADATNKQCTWSSSNTDIATVDKKGLVKAVAAGKTTITTTTEDGEKTAICAITVNAPIEVKSIKIEPTEISLLKGEFYYQLAISVMPENAHNRNYTWKSSNAAVADYNGKVIEAKSAGVATITFTTESGAKTATIKVTVTERQGQGSGNVKEIDPSGKYGERNYTLIEGIHTITAKNKVELSLKDDKGNGIVQLRFTNPLSNGRLPAGNYAIALSESGNNNTAVNYSRYSDLGYYESGTVAVSVSGDIYTIAMTDIPTSNGRKITCSYTGKFTYTNQYIDVTSVTLDKTTLSLDLGKSVQLTATVNPANAFNKKVTWSSNNINIANVDQNGYVWTSGIGNAIITVSTVDGAKTATCVVTVNALPETGNGILSDNSGRSVSIKRAEYWVNGKNSKEIDLRFYSGAALYSDLSITLVRNDGDTGKLKAGTYTVIQNLQAAELGIKSSWTNTGSVTVSINGEQYTVALNITAEGGRKITGTYIGRMISIR